MADKMRKPPLKIVAKPQPCDLEPSRTLSEAGRNLWVRITSEYDVTDAGGAELLTLACQALDRAEAGQSGEESA